MRRSSAHRLGRRAEWATLLLLMIKGYRPRHRNWRGAGGELDLVMQRSGEIVFVEVKARSDDLYGGAAAAFNDKKKPRCGSDRADSISSPSNGSAASSRGASAITATPSNRTAGDSSEAYPFPCPSPYLCSGEALPREDARHLR